MANAFYRLINPLVSRLLTSPLHGLLSGNTALLRYRGRRSGRLLQTPVSYYREGDTVHCFAGMGHRWWRNLQEGQPVELLLEGRRFEGHPRVTRGDVADLREALARFLAAVPRDARHAGVHLGQDGTADAEEVSVAAPGLVHVRIRLAEP